MNVVGKRRLKLAIGDLSNACLSNRAGVGSHASLVVRTEFTGSLPSGGSRLSVPITRRPPRHYFTD